jgi:GNAT superfamily N-acetyltransferase
MPMTSPPTTRAATIADLPALFALWQSFNAYLDTLGEPDRIDPARFERFAALCFSAHPVCGALIAERDGEALGYIVHHWGVRMDEVAPVLFIADLFVTEAARGSGAGKALITAAIEHGRSRGAARLIWQVGRANHAAIAFYEKIGARHLANEMLMTLDID